eukprot:SAG31_NODE_3073_length_4714_cov_2.744529_3_plen_650_part_00
MGVRTLASFPAGETGYSTFQPFAVVVPFENGTKVAPPQRFAGPIHETAPIPGDWRVPLLRSGATIFDGGTVYLPLKKGPENKNIACHTVELELPIGITFSPTSMRMFANMSDVSELSGGGAVQAGYHRVRLTNIHHNTWGYFEDVKLKMSVAPRLLHGLASGRRAFGGSRVRAYTGAANQKRSDNWQAWAITAVALEPVLALPKRLTTAFCWDGWAEFGSNLSSPEDFGMWRKLGFNTIPAAGVSIAPNHPGVLSPANRTGPLWKGMKYGMITNSMAVFSALKMSPAAARAVNFSALGVTSAAQVAAERAQLVAAANFFATTKMMDVSYNGIFYRNNVAAVASLVAFSQPDFLSFDIETLPPFDAWAQKAALSPNFLTRVQPGETRSAACLRIAQGWIGGVVAAARAEMPTVKPAMYTAHAIYDLGFQLTSWPMLAELGFSDQPSYYSFMNSLDRLAASTRMERLAVANSTAVIPWLSPGETIADGGPPPEDTDPGVAMFNALLQVFASGATGFHLYVHDGFVDMSLWLAVCDAIALVQPYEDMILDGHPAAATDLFGLSSNAVVSGMTGPDGSMLIAASTMPSNKSCGFSVRSLAADASWLLCELRRTGDGRSVAASAQGFASWKVPQQPGSLLLFAKNTPCHAQGTK